MLLLFALAAPIAIAAPPALVKPDAVTKPVEIMQWRSGLTEINEGWATHHGDDLKWA